ncbi:hypothetical protein DI09_361p10 [Mitosporidium daphniae]|uniref:NFACT RNA-binding domain-containing protein n=1 Tax=Mitosporidium daphniae TaxID=1485682 RepID=A0A098VUR6_9MICR|nr:uncharacterized protein DI09_361p10 [Mitosporidium daphniae]KGG51411.1 hypothetical protein DI09_361p10 [Mitosporidium daphniae]|eukprot:XP_013237847.1 uncharacterized protein DI09_361p10 [Mitosporidium daphniae]
MYQFVSNATNPPSIIYIGKDKYENDQLIKHGYGENDVWFHVDRLSSAHLYLKLIPGFAWDNLPQELLIDCSQLVKANSIEGTPCCLTIGNKKNNVDILYTPWNNLKKTQGMEVGEVAFHKPNQVKRFHVEKKDNAILNRLQKTKTEYTIDYEQEKIAREKGLRALQKDQEKAKVTLFRAFINQLESGKHRDSKCKKGSRANNLIWRYFSTTKAAYFSGTRFFRNRHPPV